MIHESSENYLKTIFLLKKQFGEVRSIDVASAMNVSKPSVSVAMKKLNEKGLIYMDSNRNLVLTDKGQKYAEDIFERHEVIEEYLMETLGVEKETAHEDACRLEHVISEESFDKIKELNEADANLEPKD